MVNKNGNQIKEKDGNRNNRHKEKTSMKDFIFPNTGWEYHKRKRDSGKGAGNTDRCWKKKIENKMISFPSKKKATDFLSAFEKCGDEVKAIISVKGYGDKFVKKVRKNAAKKPTKTKRK